MANSCFTIVTAARWERRDLAVDTKWVMYVDSPIRAAPLVIQLSK